MMFCCREYAETKSSGAEGERLNFTTDDVLYVTPHHTKFNNRIAFFSSIPRRSFVRFFSYFLLRNNNIILEAYFRDMYVQEISQIPEYSFWNLLGENLSCNLSCNLSSAVSDLLLSVKRRL